MQKTEVCKRSLNPHWNSEWFKFEVEDEVLQDEPLELRLDRCTLPLFSLLGMTVAFMAQTFQYVPYPC